MERGDDLWHKKVFRIFFYLVEKNILYVFIMVYIKKLLKNFYEFFRFTGLKYFLPTCSLCLQHYTCNCTRSDKKYGLVLVKKLTPSSIENIFFEQIQLASSVRTILFSN